LHRFENFALFIREEDAALPSMGALTPERKTYSSTVVRRENYIPPQWFCEKTLFFHNGVKRKAIFFHNVLKPIFA
jgi:hypothetical protein